MPPAPTSSTGRSALRSLALLTLPLILTLASLAALADEVPEPKPPRPPALKVLFVGNSYTYYNNLPSMLMAMAFGDDSPRSIYATASTIPGGTLQDHWEKGEAAKAIGDGKWDFVVLQEQSLRPTTDPKLMYTYAHKLHALIRDSGAKTLLYLTWARLAKPKMQDTLDRNFAHLAAELPALVAPVGPAWRLAREQNPDLPLYLEDGSHPSPTGSYLAACVFYLVLQDGQKSCPPLDDTAIEPAHAALAREAAAKAVAAARP